MQTAFRWYGPYDRVPLLWLRQMTPQPLVVTHLDAFLPGEEWTVEALCELREHLDHHELSLGPIESVFWSDAMKLGRPERDAHIERYAVTLRNLRTVFPELPEIIVTYNLMPLDWGRTELAMVHPNGARGLAFDQAALDEMDLSQGLYLPGWGKGYSKDDFDRLQEEYAGLGEEGVWENIGYCLRAIVPVAEVQGIRLAAHPNDPPWSTFGLPAVLCGAPGIRRLLSLAPSHANGLCFCTGSYSSDPANDVLGMLREFKDNIAWLHLRAVKTTGPKRFHEADHADLDANVDLLTVMQTVVELGWDGIFRSDHGLDMLYETEMEMRGYPAIDRYAANKMLWAYWRALSTKNSS
ncbi:MAG: mannonate dehydratase [Armatimonadaceae bacterium]